MAIDMETATLFTVGFCQQNSYRCTADGFRPTDDFCRMKTTESDRLVSLKFVDTHILAGIDSFVQIKNNGLSVKHLRF